MLSPDESSPELDPVDGRSEDVVSARTCVAICVRVRDVRALNDGMGWLNAWRKAYTLPINTADKIRLNRLHESIQLSLIDTGYKTTGKRKIVAHKNNVPYNKAVIKLNQGCCSVQRRRHNQLTITAARPQPNT